MVSLGNEHHVSHVFYHRGTRAIEGHNGRSVSWERKGDSSPSVHRNCLDSSSKERDDEEDVLDLDHGVSMVKEKV